MASHIVSSILGGLEQLKLTITTNHWQWDWDRLKLLNYLSHSDVLSRNYSTRMKSVDRTSNSSPKLHVLPLNSYAFCVQRDFVRNTKHICEVSFCRLLWRCQCFCLESDNVVFGDLDNFANDSLEWKSWDQIFGTFLVMANLFKYVGTSCE